MREAVYEQQDDELQELFVMETSVFKLDVDVEETEKFGSEVKAVIKEGGKKKWVGCRLGCRGDVLILCKEGRSGLMQARFTCESTLNEN